MSFCSHARAQTQQEEWYPYKNAEGHWLFIAVDGEQLNGVLYDSIVPFRSRVALVMQNRKWGVIDREGKYIVPPQFDTITFSGSNVYFEGYLIAGKNFKNGTSAFGLFNPDGSEILPMIFRSIEIIQNKRYYNWFNACIAAQSMDTLMNGGIGMYNLEGKQLLPHEYSSITELPYDDRYIENYNFSVYVTKRVDKKNTLIGAYNTSLEKWIFPCKYDSKYFHPEYLYYQPYRNTTSIRPINSELTLLVPAKADFNKYSYDYYTTSGTFLYNSNDFSIDVYDSLYYYTVGDSIIGKTTKSSIKRLCDSLDRYILQYGESMALYDLQKGFLIDSGLYLNNPTINLEEGYISVQKLNEYEHAYFDFEGTIYPVEKNLKSNYHKGQPIIRDENGNLLDMSPYSIQGIVSSAAPSYYYFAKKEDKWGIITAEKEILLGFEYDYLSNNHEYYFIVATKGNKIILYDYNLNKIDEFKNVKWEGLDYDAESRFRLLKSKKTFRVYDLKNQQIIFKRQPVLNKSDLDSLNSVGVEVDFIATRVSDSLTILQMYNPNKGWSYYTTTGELIIEAPEKSFFPMQPIIVQNNLTGVIYVSMSNGSYAKHYGQRYNQKYLFFNGLILNGLDTVSSIYYDPSEKIFSAIDVNQNQFRFSKEGKLLCKYKEINTSSCMGILGTMKKVYIVKDEKGSNICDSNYQELVSEEFSTIREERFFHVGYKDKKMYIISIGKDVIVSKPYIKMKQFGSEFTLAYSNETDYDLYDAYGKLLYANVTYCEDNSLFYIIRAHGYEYWLTKKGREYAQHRIEL